MHPLEGNNGPAHKQIISPHGKSEHSISVIYFVTITPKLFRLILPISTKLCMKIHNFRLILVQTQSADLCAQIFIAVNPFCRAVNIIYIHIISLHIVNLFLCNSLLFKCIYYSAHLFGVTFNQADVCCRIVIFCNISSCYIDSSVCVLPVDTVYNAHVNCSFWFSLLIVC